MMVYSLDRHCKNTGRAGWTLPW